MGSPTIPPTSPAKVQVDAQTYPGVGQVQETNTQIALRLVHDLLRMLQLKSVPTRGTLSPDQRPTLEPMRRGFLFWASDFDRVFLWNGLSWQDAPGQPARGSVSWFPAGIPPGPGWALCDGRSSQITASDGTVRGFSAPVVDQQNGLQAWIRL